MLCYYFDGVLKHSVEFLSNKKKGTLFIFFSETPEGDNLFKLDFL